MMFQGFEIYEVIKPVRDDMENITGWMVVESVHASNVKNALRYARRVHGLDADVREINHSVRV